VIFTMLIPVRPLQILGRGRNDAPKILPEPIRLPVAVQAGDLHLIAADLVFQVSQQRQWQPLRREVGAVVADDPRQGAQVPFAGRHRSCHQVPLPQQYAGCGGLGIGRTPDSSDGAGLRTLTVDGKYLLEDSDAPTTHAACRRLPSTRWPYKSIVTLATVHPEGPGRRLERLGVFISHITDGKPTEAWRKS
jgi:hypothetical protein